MDSRTPANAIALHRSPQRLSITIPGCLFDWIHEQAGREGRSASNLAAYLLEQARDQSAPRVTT